MYHIVELLALVHASTQIDAKSTLLAIYIHILYNWLQLHAQKCTILHDSKLLLIVTTPMLLEKDLYSNDTIPGGINEGTTQVAVLLSLLSARTRVSPKVQLIASTEAKEQGSDTVKETVSPPTSYP